MPGVRLALVPLAAVAAFGLCLVEALVGEGEQFCDYGRIARYFGAAGDAGAEGEADFVCFGREYRVPDFSEYTLCHACNLRAFGVRRYNDELFSAEATRKVVGANHRGDEICEFLQDDVAGYMAVGVVDCQFGDLFLHFLLFRNICVGAVHFDGATFAVAFDHLSPVVHPNLSSVLVLHSSFEFVKF